MEGGLPWLTGLSMSVTTLTIITSLLCFFIKEESSGVVASIFQGCFAKAHVSYTDLGVRMNK